MDALHFLMPFLKMPPSDTPTSLSSLDQTSLEEENEDSFQENIEENGDEKGQSQDIEPTDILEQISRDSENENSVLDDIKVDNLQQENDAASSNENQGASAKSKETIKRDNKGEQCERNVPQESATSTHSKKASPRLREKKHIIKVRRFNKTFADAVHEKKARISSDDDDPRRLFLLSLLPDVHAMTDFQMRKFRILVLQAVDKVLEDHPKNKYTHYLKK